MTYLGMREKKNNNNNNNNQTISSACFIYEGFYSKPQRKHTIFCFYKLKYFNNNPINIKASL